MTKMVDFAGSLLLALGTVMSSAQSSPLPVLDNAIPASAAPGGRAFVLSVYGGPFTSNAVLNWNASPRPTTVVSSSRLQAQISDIDIQKNGTASITVTNSASDGSGSN